MSSFYTKDNLLFVINVFNEYMEDTYGVKLDQVEDIGAVRKTMFGFMSDVNDVTKEKRMGIEEKNIMLLAKTKQYYTKQLQLGEKSGRKPNIQNLSRDKDVFGNRQVVLGEKRPEIDPYSRRTDVNDTTERMMMDRYRESRDEEVGLVKKQPDPRIIAPLDKDLPESQEEFYRKIKALEDARADPPMKTMEVLGMNPNNNTMGLDPRIMVEKERNEANALDKHDPKALFMKPLTEFNTMSSSIASYTKTRQQQTQMGRHTSPFGIDDDDNFDINSLNNAGTTGTGNNDPSNMFQNNRQDLLIQRPTNSTYKLIPKYININSFDRNWTVDTKRYSYSVNFQAKENDIMNKYKNIESIAVSRVIIPEEVITSNSIVNQEKTAFNHEFSFSFPYLLLSIDEFTDVYDGTNQNARKAFATLIYYRHYKAPNGRGYVILQPIQQEEKVFYPNLLSSMPKLSIKLLKPNGQLLNDSSDEYKIFKIDYENFNPQYVKIVTHVYFDKNEFYVGDMCVFSSFVITPVNQAATDFNMFINRPEGHEIKQLGSPNDQGFYRTFYIEAPGKFNKTLGQFEVTMAQINALNDYNSPINYNTVTTINGSIMNSSLQNSISMKLRVAVSESPVTAQLL